MNLLLITAVLFAYEQIGGSQASLDMAVIMQKRYAFGRPIGSYQAIKHKLADMYIALTLAKSNCYYGLGHYQLIQLISLQHQQQHVLVQSCLSVMFSRKHSNSWWKWIYMGI